MPSPSDYSPSTMTKPISVGMDTPGLHKVDSLDRIVVFCVLVLLTITIAGTLRSDTHFEGAYAITYEAYYRSLMLLIICGYLLLKRHWLVRLDPVTRVVMWWGVWVVVSSLFWDVDHTVRFFVLSDIPVVLLWPLVYLFFYAVGKLQSLVMTRRLVAFFCVLFFFCAAGFWQAYNLANLFLFLSKGAAVLNEIYYPLLLLPWILLLNNRAWHYLGLAALFVMVLLSFKRTALFAFGAAALAHTWTFKRQLASAKSRLISVFAFTLLIIGALIVFPIIDEKMDFTFSKKLLRSELERAGGRPELYLDTITMILDSAPLPAMLGHGHLAVREDSPLRSTAHNDWLEVAYDYGAGGLLLYGLLHGFLLAKCRRLVVADSPYAPAFTVSYILFFLMSLSSHLIIYPTYFVFLTAFWGMVGGLTAPADNLPPPAFPQS